MVLETVLEELEQLKAAHWVFEWAATLDPEMAMMKESCWAQVTDLPLVVQTVLHLSGEWATMMDY